jgi:hypothetical protein
MMCIKSFLINFLIFLALHFLKRATSLEFETDQSIFSSKPPDPRAIDANVFGVIGDGIHDDTDALQRAINATYSSSFPKDCTEPGARIIFLQGDGKRYLLSSSLHMWIWTRLIGYGSIRPVLFINEATPLFSNSSQLTPLIKVINSIPNPNNGSTCDRNLLDGGNTAFGVGVINVDITIPSQNPGAVGIRNRAAQGGILRSIRFNLASDVAGGVHSPGWSHQDLHFVGGKTGVLIYDTGAWPSIFRDCIFDSQEIAGIAWDRVSRDANPTSSWEGITVVRGSFLDSICGIDASNVTSARFTILDSGFFRIGTVIKPPILGFGNSSFAINNTVGVASPILVGTSDISTEILSPGGSLNSFIISSIFAGPQSHNITASNGLVPISIFTNATESSVFPTLPQRDTLDYPSPVSSWLSVTDFGIQGDGVTDNTEKMNAFLYNAPQNASLYFPLGTYAFSNQILIPEKGLTFFGLSCWDVVLSLLDSAPLFKNPNNLVPFITVGGFASNSSNSSGRTGIFSLNIRTGFSFGVPQPPPVPTGWQNPNPGAIALLWQASLGGGLQDVFFHPATWPDNQRMGTGPNTELSLVINGEKTRGTFSDIWSCNSYSMGGVRVKDTRQLNKFYQLSTEHHVGHELWISNASDVFIHTMQTEDRSPDAAPTASVIVEGESVVQVTGLFAYYAANIPSLGAVIADETSSISISVFRQYHSYHPMYYNCSFLLLSYNESVKACVLAKDFAFVKYTV